MYDLDTILVRLGVVHLRENFLFVIMYLGEESRETTWALPCVRTLPYFLQSRPIT